MTTNLPTYADEPCWCGAPSVLVQLTDHGHVVIAACATRHGALVLVVGVDPGLTGAVAILTPAGHLVDVYDLPVIERDES